MLKMSWPGLAMEAALAYGLYCWTVGTPYEFWAVLLWLVVIGEAIYFAYERQAFLDPEERILRRVSQGVASIAIAGLWFWYAQRTHSDLDWLYVIAVAVGLYMIATGMQYGWAFPFKPNYLVRALIKIGVGVALISRFDIVGHVGDTMWYGWMVVGIRCYAIFCIATGITRALMASGLICHFVVSYRRKRLEAELRKQGTYGDGDVPHL